MTKTIGARLEELRQRGGLTLAQIAGLAGYAGPSSLQRYFSPHYDPQVLDYKLAVKLANAMKGAGDPPIEPYEIMSLTHAAGLESPSRPVPVIMQLEGKSVVEIYDTQIIKAESCGLDLLSEFQITLVNQGYSQSVLVPPYLEHRKVYAFRNSGSGMEPRYEDDEIIFTEAKRRAGILDYVFVELHSSLDVDPEMEEVVGVLAQLQGGNADGILLAQSETDLVLVPTDKVRSIRRVMTIMDILT